MPASLAAMVPCVHRHADVGLGERRSVVRAIAGHGDELALSLLASYQLHLLLRRRLRQVVVDAGLFGDGGGGERVVAGDHDRPDAHGAKLVEALLDAALDDVLQVDDADRFLVAHHGQRRATRTRDVVGDERQGGRGVAALLPDPVGDGIDGALSDPLTVPVDAAHSRLRREGHEVGLGLADVPVAEAELLRENYDASAPPASRR